MTRSQRLFDALSTFGPMDCYQAAQVTHDDREYISSTFSDMRARGLLTVDGSRRYPGTKRPVVRYRIAARARRPAGQVQVPRAPVVVTRAPERLEVHAPRVPLRTVEIQGRTLYVMWDGTGVSQ